MLGGGHDTMQLAGAVVYVHSSDVGQQQTHSREELRELG